MFKKVFFLIFLSFTVTIYAFTDQITLDRILKENKGFIKFLNICISNFGDKEKEEFFKIYQLHFNAQVAYLQADYVRAFKNVYISQKYNSDLYNKVLTDFYLEDSKFLLDKLAPGIIKSKNDAAKLYLTLAYRDRSISRNMQKVGNASHPRLYSYKIHKYYEAIKVARRSMRYGLLALFESQSTGTKVEIYKFLLAEENKDGSLFYARFLNKTGDDLLKEMNREYKSYAEEYQKIIKRYKKSDKTEIEEKRAESKEDSEDKKEEKSDKIQRKYLEEKNVERRVRFRHEKRVAKYLNNLEFGKAEDLMRKYVDDFNFKLIDAAIIVYKNKNKNEINIDVKSIKKHHIDNFARLSEESILNTYIKKVKVVDSIPQKAKSENKLEEKKDEAEKDNIDAKKDEEIKDSEEKNK